MIAMRSSVVCLARPAGIAVCAHRRDARAAPAKAAAAARNSRRFIAYSFRFRHRLRPMSCPRTRELSYSMRVTLHGCSCGVAAAMGVLLSAQSPPPQRSHPHFRDVADASGLHFVHHTGSTSRKLYVDSVPGGLAVFDYNGGGRPDIFVTEGAEMPSLQKPTRAYANRLFRNDGGLRFTDVTDEAGVAGIGYAMGAAAADYDNDGR